MLKPMKFKLQTKTLEVLYKSVVRSYLEYADIVWDGCCDVDRDLLESLQYESARLVTGALKSTHRHSLLKETAWITLKDRRNDHGLIMMYKIVNNLVNTYLSELFLENASSRSNRSSRANDNLIVLFARTERYKKSFLISSANLCNSLPITIRSCCSVASVKNRVIQRHNSITPNPLFYTGERLSAVLHTRLRLCNSTLNHDLYLKNCVNSPSCSCGFPRETVVHFFFECDQYAVIRDILLTSAAHLIDLTHNDVI